MAKKSNAATKKKELLKQKLAMNAINADRYRVFEKGENIGYTNATVIMLWLLHTQYGFGKKRLALLLNNITDFCERYVLPTKNHKEGEFGGVTLEDMAQALKDECGISIDIYNGLINVDGLEVVKVKETEEMH